MDEGQALSAFGALSQETRLRIVRLLVQAGPDGMAAGSIADAAGVSASNVSFHLKELTLAGLAKAKRAARSINYTADYAGLAGLSQFLMQDCCAGHPAVCKPAKSGPSKSGLSKSGLSESGRSRPARRKAAR